MKKIKSYYILIINHSMELTKEQKKEIQEQQSQKYSTKRVTSPDLEKILLDEAIPVLDHGFVRVVDYKKGTTLQLFNQQQSLTEKEQKVSTDSGL